MIRTVCLLPFIAALVAVAEPSQVVRPYGVCAHRMQFAEDRAKALTNMVANGIGHVRVDCNWEWIEPEKGKWTFEQFDALFEDAARIGLKVLPILHHGAPWTRPYEEHYDDWCNFVRVFVERYGGHCDAVEIWNEVNLRQVGVGSPELYAKFLKGARDEIKKVDPRIKVTTSGFAGPAIKWVEAIYRTVGRDAFDIVNFHHYSFPYEVEDSTLESDYRRLRDLMSRNGDRDKPVWLTECGYPTHSPSLVMHNVFKSQLPIFDSDRGKWRVRMVVMGDETDNEIECYARLMRDELPEGSEFKFVFANKLAEKLREFSFDVLVLPFNERVPDDVASEMLEFIRRGGVVAQFGSASMSYMVPRGEDGVYRFRGGGPNGRRTRMRFGFDVVAHYEDTSVPERAKVRGTDSSYEVSTVDVKVGMWSLGSVWCSRWMVPVESKDLPGLSFTPLLGFKDKEGRSWTAAARLRLPGEKAGGLIIGCMDENDQNLMTSTLDRQARMVARQYLIAERIGCEEVFWYVYKTWEGDTEARRLHREPWFGLVRPKTEEPKPSMIALKTLSAMRPAGSVVRGGAWRDEDAGVYFPQWTTPDGVNGGALWAKAHRIGEPKREPHVFEFRSGEVEFFDYLGRPSADVSPLGGGKFGVRLSDGVVYFRGSELVKCGQERANGERGNLVAYSMLTRDGRRMVSRVEGTNTVYELVPTNRLPADLPPVREWKLYGLKATHTDIGLHNAQYVQRHGTVKRIDEAARLIDSDARSDDDPAAYRYVMEGFWFWNNYHQDRGEDAAWRIVTNYIARGRMDVGVTCAGNHTHLFSKTELERSTRTKRILAEKWGIGTRTFIMADNPGISCSVIAPYVRAGIRYGVFLPNQWNPIPSTIWKCMEKAVYNNPDVLGGGNRIAVSHHLSIPLVFRWKAPTGSDSLLVWCSPHYRHGYKRLGFGNEVGPSSMPEAEKLMPAFLSMLEEKYPYDVWLGGVYGDDEPPNTGFADFAASWNEKWAWPQFRTVGRLDEPFEYIERNFGNDIPTLTGEMTSGWLQHAVSTPELLADKLNADRMLETAERLGEFVGTIDCAAVDMAWWYLICNDEHSYGTSGYQGRRVFETWMQRRDWIERATYTASNELQKAVAKLGLRVPPVPDVTEDPLVPCRDGLTENRWYRVVVTNGVVYSIYDKQLKRELVDGPANRLLYTRDNHKTWEADPDAALGAKVTRRIYLAEDSKRIDVEDRFEHARDLFNSRRYYRYGYLAFPFAVPGGSFVANLNGAVVRPYEGCHPMTTDAYCAVRDWCAVENGSFGVALMMRDSTLTEFGEIHPDKTCYTGKPPIGKTAIYPYLFNDWLQMHQPDGDSMNFVFRFSITSYAGSWKNADVPRICDDWLDPYAKWMRDNNVPRVTRETVADLPSGWTGLLEKPRAGHGERDGQMYLLWGAEMSPDFSHYELYRDGNFLASVTNEACGGISYRVARYEDTGLPTHSRHEYRIRKVWKGGRKDPIGGPFYGRTRHVSEDERNGVVCEGELGRLYVRYDGATVTSWTPVSLKGEEVFFMPKNAEWGTEVHGGLPICWPWFGKREGLPNHGLARYMKWQLVRRIGKVCAEFETESTPETMKAWPYKFKLSARIAMSGPDSLTISLTETNTGASPFDSAWGFHPYFRVSDATNVAIDDERQPMPCLRVVSFVNDKGRSRILTDLVNGRRVSVESADVKDWLVWNPGVEFTPICRTLEADEWQRFYCVEPCALTPRTILPGKSRTSEMTIKIECGAAVSAAVMDGP